MLSTYAAAKAILKRSPRTVAAVCMVSVCAQLTKIVAFLLPIKAILVAGASSLPHYYSIISEDVNREGVISVLAGGSILFYMLHLYLERVRDQRVNRYFSIEWSKEKTVVDTDSFNVVDYKIINGLMEFLASGMFVFLLSPIWIVFPSFSLHILVLIASFLSLVVISKNLRNELAHWFERDAVGCTGVLTSLVFLGGFVVILKNVESGETGVLMGILNLLLFRIFLSQFQVLVSRSEAFALRYDRFHELDTEQRALVISMPRRGLSFAGVSESFFYEIVSSGEMGNKKNTFEELMGLSRLFIGGRYCFRFLGDQIPGPNSDYFAVWKSGKMTDYIAEKKLLDHHGHLSPVFPKIVKDIYVGGSYCRLYNVGGHRDCDSSEFSQAKSIFSVDLWAMETAEISDVHLKEAGKGICYRLTYERISVLQVWGVERGFNGYLDELEWSKVLAWLESLPLQLVVPVTEESLLYDPNNKTVCCMNWQGLKVEPLGYLLNGAVHRINLASALAEAQKVRPELLRVSVSDIEKVSLLSQLDFFIERARYVKALELFQKFGDCWRHDNEH